LERWINIVDARRQGGDRVAGPCFQWKWFGPLHKAQPVILGAMVFWWLNCEADVGSKCVVDSMRERWIAY